MEQELLSMDYDILQAIASSEGLSSTAGSKAELVRRIIEHRQQMRGPDRVLADLQFRDESYIRNILIEKGFNEELLQNIMIKDSLIALYEMITDLEQEPMDRLIASYRWVKNDIKGKPNKNMWLNFLPGDGSGQSRTDIINKLILLSSSQLANQEAQRRWRIQENERLRQALATMPDNMRDGAPSQLGVPRAASPGGGAGMAPPDKKQQIIASLLGMGISQELAQQAALRTSSAEAALNWILAQQA